MTGSNPAGEQVEGNVTEIDISAHYFILADRQAKPFLKVFWTAAIEGPADNPSYVFKKIRKLQPGYFAAPMVKLEEKTGGLQEAILIDLPWKDRPADFPKPGKTGGSGGRPYTPRNEKIVVYECVYKANADNIRAMLPLVDATGRFNAKDFADLYNDLMDIAMTRTLKDAAELCKAGGA